jgi:hypothetical protein
MQMVKMAGSVEIDQILRQIEELKKKFNGNAPAPLTQLRTPTADIPVRGNVSASQPTLLPHQIVQPSEAARGPAYRPAFRPITLETAPSVSMSLPAEQQLTVLTVDQAMTKWPSLIDEARKERIALGTMLSESMLIDVNENLLHVTCPDDFHLDTLRRNRDFISQLTQKVYGSNVRLEATLSERPPGTVNSPDTPRSTGDPPASGDGILAHPVVRALMKEFGAQPIE